MHPPERIENDIAQGQLRLYWADTVIVLNHTALRGACRCAEYRFKRHHDTPISVPTAMHITTVAPAGYGVQLVFSNRRAHGIYSQTYLAELAATTAAG